MIRKMLLAVTVLLSALANAQNGGEPESDAWITSSAKEIKVKKEWKELKAPVCLMVVNDLGRNGYYQQKPIAELMGIMAEEIGPDAVLALGDVHHFEGVQSIQDPLWMTNYETIYSHPELMIDWFAVCGNHEYRGNTGAVRDYSQISRRWQMPAKYYSHTFLGKGATVKVIFLDTTPLIDKYRTDSADYPDATAQDMQAQLQWLDKELSEATEDWIVVVGHHPIYADTPKDESERTDMQQRVNTILKKHRVDMYLCGHIHNFQHINRNDIDYIVNSSGSLSRKNVKPVEGTVFTSGEAGYSVLGATKSKLTLSMIDDKGNTIHRITKTK